MFGKKRPYNRSEVMARAEAARGKGNRKKAIAEFRKILAEDPNDLAVHQKLAPILAQAGLLEDARKSFNAAAEGHLKQGFADRAIAVYAHATTFFPRDEKLWNELARLHRERSRKADAVKVYVSAHQHFRGKKQREVAVRLLRSALEIEPLHVDATVNLARLLKQEGQKEDARRLLDSAAAQLRGAGLKQIRKAQFGLSKSPAALWRWMRT